MPYITVIVWYEGYRPMYINPRDNTYSYGIDSLSYSVATEQARNWAALEGIAFVPMNKV